VGDEAISERVVEELQRRILNGQIPVGSWLRHSTIAEEFGVSRTPVREALRVLHAQGIVTIVRNRGARVNGHSGRDVRELGEVRAALEGLAAELAVERINDAQIRQMEKALEDFAAALEKYAGNPELALSAEANQRWSETNRDFHSAILAGSGNHHLVLSIEDVGRRLPLNSSYPVYAGNSRLLKQNLEEHQRIATAIREHDADGAREAMVAHIRSASESLARYVEETERRR
jgi:Transcriptional regulators